MASCRVMMFGGAVVLWELGPEEADIAAGEGWEAVPDSRPRPQWRAGQHDGSQHGDSNGRRRADELQCRGQQHQRRALRMMPPGARDES